MGHIVIQANASESTGIIAENLHDSRIKDNDIDAAAMPIILRKCTDIDQQGNQIKN